MSRDRVEAFGLSAKITLVVKPDSINYVNSIGVPRVKATVAIQNNFIYSMVLKATSYRKALRKIEELGPDNCIVTISGQLVAHNKIEGAGFTITEKIKKEIEPTIIDEVIEPIIPSRPKLSLKPKLVL